MLIEDRNKGALDTGVVMKCYLTSVDKKTAEMDLYERFGADIYTRFIDGLNFRAELFEESDDFDSRVRLNFHVQVIDTETGKELFGITPNHLADAELIQELNAIVSKPHHSNFTFAVRLIEGCDHKTEWCELSIHANEQELAGDELMFGKNCPSNVQWGCADEL